MDLSSLTGMLAPYLKAAPGSEIPGADQHFEAAATHIPAEVLGSGIAEAFNSQHTPAFAEMLSGLFGRGNPMQRARILTELFRAAGPAVLASLAGGRLRDMAAARATNGSPEVTPDEAAKVNPAEVEHAAKAAESQSPGLVRSMSSVLSQHPDLVKGLGGAALTIALARIAQRMKH